MALEASLEVVAVACVREDGLNTWVVTNTQDGEKGMFGDFFLAIASLGPASGLVCEGHTEEQNQGNFGLISWPDGGHRDVKG